MAGDDGRMHSGNMPGLVPGRGHERNEEKVSFGEREPGEKVPDPTADAALPAKAGSSADRLQDSTTGGEVADRSGTIRDPADEQA